MWYGWSTGRPLETLNKKLFEAFTLCVPPPAGVTRMERVYLALSFASNSFAYQPKQKLQSTRAESATWLNGAKEYYFEF